MNSAARKVSSLLRRPSQAIDSLNSVHHHHQQLEQLQQWRGIRVKVLHGNLEQALAFMQRKMQSSGVERLIKNEQTHHIKNSEKRVLARKNLERKLRSQDLARKLKAILVKKVRGL
ncbi:Ribosomal protein S21 family protein [Quillaja saponaria]|uniref:Ribosomal protein S21 family protein n=1 Tax=Quillaja saponaria TaxID=32244 RepID=A0AAD7KV28_QUISA|nr:Ribosomal protein S21 family protein [Quillaja saponaria]